MNVPSERQLSSVWATCAVPAPSSCCCIQLEMHAEALLQVLADRHTVSGIDENLCQSVQNSVAS